MASVNRAEITPGTPERRALVSAFAFVVSCYEPSKAERRITLARNPKTGRLGVAYRDPESGLITGFWAGPVSGWVDCGVNYWENCEPFARLGAPLTTGEFITVWGGRDKRAAS